MNACRRIPLLVLAVACGGALHAQPAQQQPASDLGSPAAAQAAVSTDYRALVTAALPRVGADGLAERLRSAAKEGAADLQVKDARSWAALFDLTLDASGFERAQRAAEIVDLERGSLLVRPAEGRLWVAINQGEAKPYSRDEFAKLIPEIRRAHLALAERIGIPRGQVFFTDFRETLAQSSPRRGLAGAHESAIESVGATTTLLRAVGGLLVDGSRVRISSVDAKRIEMVDVRWPRVALACEADAAKVLAPAQLVDQLVERVAAAAQKRPVSVRMAVVLRPLRDPYRSEFVPALRVGVVPQSERLKDGYRTEAVEVFYVDLVPGFEEKDLRELAPENLERKEGRSSRSEDLGGRRPE